LPEPVTFIIYKLQKSAEESCSFSTTVRKDLINSWQPWCYRGSCRLYQL